MENKELKERFIDEKTGIEYLRQGDYYIPNLVLPKQKQIHLNKYGRMRLNYLKEHKKAEYTIMFMENTLVDHLEEIQETAIKRVNQIISDLKAKSDLTEDMKNTDMLYLIISIIVIGISISIFVNPIWLIAAINIVVGIGLILSAISNITNILAIRTNDSIWWSFAIIPIITLVLGFVIIINPVGMASFMTRIEGISLILDAVSTWIVMYRIKKFLD